MELTLWSRQYSWFTNNPKVFPWNLLLSSIIFKFIRINPIFVLLRLQKSIWILPNSFVHPLLLLTDQSSCSKSVRAESRHAAKANCAKMNAIGGGKVIRGRKEKKVIGGAEDGCNELERDKTGLGRRGTHTHFHRYKTVKNLNFPFILFSFLVTYQISCWTTYLCFFTEILYILVEFICQIDTHLLLCF